MQTADMVPCKATKDFPVASRCTTCRARVSARDCSVYRSPARPTPLSSRTQAKTVLSANHRSQGPGLSGEVRGPQVVHPRGHTMELGRYAPTPSPPPLG